MADELQTKLDKARATEAELREKLEKVKAEPAGIDAERAKHAFAAHTGSEVAKRALEKLTKRKAELAAEIESLETALAEAQRRVAAAEKEVSVAAERERALAAIGWLHEFRACGRAVDDALDLAVAKYERARTILFELQKLGFTFPTVSQLAALGRRAVLTSLMASQDLRVEHLAPHERQSMSGLLNGWADQVEKLARYRAGIEKKDAAA